MIRYFEHIKQCFPYPFVGLAGCSKVSNSGLYINSLEGITFKRLAELQHAELPTIDELYKSIHDKSVIELYMDFLGYLSKNKFTFNHLLEEYKVGYNGEEIKETGYDKFGFEVEKTCDDNFTLLKIDEISLVPDCDADTTVYIQDGLIEHRYSVKLLGQTVNKLPLNYITFNNKITISLKDCENFTIYDYKGTCGCTGNCTCYSCSSCFQAKPFFSTNDIVTYKNNGMTLTGSCICDPAKLLCKYSTYLAVPLQYKIGINLMLEAEQSDSVSLFLTVGQKKIIENLRRWRGGLDPLTGYKTTGSYANYMNSTVEYILKSIKSMSSKCLDCKGAAKINVRL